MRWTGLLVIGTLAVGCGGGSDPISPPPPPPPPPPTPVASVAVAPETLTVIPAGTRQLTATPKDAQGNALSGRTITWSTNASSVAMVSSAGLVTGVAAGTARVTATVEGQAATAQVTVLDGAAVGTGGGSVSQADGSAEVIIPSGALPSDKTITVAPVASPPADPKLVVGTAHEFGPPGTTFSQPVTIKLKYQPSQLSPTAAPIRFRLHRYSGSAWQEVTGSTVDTATKTVSGQTSSFSMYAVVETAAPVPVATVTVDPLAPTVAVGDSVQLSATTKDAQGNTLTGRTVTWSSNTPNVATVSSDGKVQAVAPGTATIIATSETKTGQATVTVPDAGPVALNTLSVGVDHTCAIGTDQAVYCWGDNKYGELGDGTDADRAVPTKAAVSGQFVMVGTGNHLTCALEKSGSVWCWGSNEYGALGNAGSTTLNRVPAQVSGLSATAIAVGATHVCALLNGGAVSCWGNNGSGQIAQSTGVASSSLPHQVSGVPALVAITAGGRMTCGIADLGKVWCWGADKGDLGIGSGNGAQPIPTLVNTAVQFRQLSAGASSVCGIGSDQGLYCWGSNFNGTVGDGTTMTRSGPVAIGAGMQWRMASVGLSGHACAVTTSDQVYCWGRNYEGQIGNGSYTDVLVPTAVPGTGTVVAAGETTTCRLDATGQASCWGRNRDGNLGNGEFDYSTVPVRVQTSLIARDISTSEAGACLITDTQAMRCWAISEAATTPTTTFAPDSFRVISMGITHRCAVRLTTDSSTTRTVVCWGNNNYGQLGSSGANFQTDPTPIAETSKYTMLAAGWTQTCGITEGRRLFCWGQNRNLFNQLPAERGGQGLAWTSVTGRWQVTCGTVDTPTKDAYCWTYLDPPALESQSQRWNAMVAGRNHVCGVAESGLAYCRGKADYGQLGDGSSTDRSVLGAVSGGHQFVQLVAGESFSCGLTAGGDVFCWGDNDRGELGDGTTLDRSTPVQVLGGVKFSRLGAGGFYMCAVTAAGEAYCWGSNEGSQLGIGRRDDVAQPVTVSGSQRFRVPSLPLGVSFRRR